MNLKPKETLINPKYGSQRFSNVCTSYLLLTNHMDAIGELSGDRRVYVIYNTLAVGTPEYFTKLNNWLDIKDNKGRPKWALSVWRWLQTIKPDMQLLNSPTPLTEAKKEMIAQTPKCT